MINNDRIIPITNIDYLSLIMTAANVTSVLSDTGYEVTAVTDGTLTINAMGDESVPQFANEPVKKIDISNIGSDARGMALFVPDYDFEGLYSNGNLVEPREGSSSVRKDGVSLYAVQAQNGQAMITAVTPDPPAGE